jgi:hypothetical protein
MSLKKIALALSLGILVMHPIKSAFGLCNPEGAFGACGDKEHGANRILCGRYSLSFSAAIVPSGQIAGSGAITSDGNPIHSGTGTVSFSLIPPNPTVSCPIVNFSEAIAVGQDGGMVKAVNTGSAEVTIQEEWVRQ